MKILITDHAGSIDLHLAARLLAQVGGAAKFERWH